MAVQKSGSESPAHRATLTDVAALAGVTPGTASKALNGRGRLRPETRQRVLEAAQRLDFQPNALAQSLLTGRSSTVGLLTTDSIGRFSLPVLLGAEDALGAGQISVLLCDSRGDAIRERHYLRTLIARGVDGIIVTGRRTDPRPPLPGPLPVPTVYALGPSADSTDDSVVSDDAHGVHLAVRHLLDTGRTRIAHVTGPEHHAAAAVRSEHTRAELTAAGLELATGRPHFGEWSEAWGRQASAIVLRAAPDCDALLCGNDQIARGVTDALRESGRRVPQDIAVVGYDNWDVMALAARPPLTTVDTNLAEVGRIAALHLLDALDGRPHQGITAVPCRLVVRDSSAPGVN
ncbi:LacI family DNA-binding transcriptional regulator [Streptomyces violens]|uniref:LacI family DNA-binding transcriptional regulator n=1 Tax=Streptomyces violens TaxID=66377 RepID=UPI0004C154EA|nr:LacI family DNA-binding transcriptional regulator [Streptomyces violens]